MISSKGDGDGASSAHTLGPNRTERLCTEGELSKEAVARGKLSILEARHRAAIQCAGGQGKRASSMIDMRQGGTPHGELSGRSTSFVTSAGSLSL